VLIHSGGPTAWDERRLAPPRSASSATNGWCVSTGFDTATGKHRPRQLGTFASQRAALAAARSGQADRRSTERGTVSCLVRRYVAGRTDITVKSRESYEWAIPHIEAGLGAIPVYRLDREDVAEWIERLAAEGQLSRRSVRICRTVLRAALAEAVDEGIIPRSPAARVALPRTVAKPARVKEIDAWDAADVTRFLEATRAHRWAVGFRLECSMDSDVARCWRSTGTTSTSTPRHCASTRASSPSARAPHGATPRTSDHGDGSRSMTRRSAA
jgi:hypothetical protein